MLLQISSVSDDTLNAISSFISEEKLIEICKKEKIKYRRPSDLKKLKNSEVKIERKNY